jgi:Fur family transcriptional regulator, iron response regulator
MVAPYTNSKMISPLKITATSDTHRLLREHGISPTAQRVLITRVLLADSGHVAAEDLFRRVNQTGDIKVSKATVYNTLARLLKCGLIRSVIADPDRVMYDSNVSPHHHFYDEGSGKLIDVDAADVKLTGLPPLPEGTELKGVDVIIRVGRAARK